MPYDWDKKQGNPTVKRPDFCPHCGAALNQGTETGWKILYPIDGKRQVLCLGCNGKSDEAA